MSTKLPTMQELATILKGKDCHYFDTKMLQLFDQTLNDFQVFRTNYSGIYRVLCDKGFGSWALPELRVPGIGKGSPFFRGSRKKSQAYISIRTGKCLTVMYGQRPIKIIQSPEATKFLLDHFNEEPHEMEKHS